MFKYNKNEEVATDRSYLTGLRKVIHKEVTFPRKLKNYAEERGLK